MWRNSCCHDIDMLCWLFPNAISIEFDSDYKVDPSKSVVQIKGLIKHKTAASSTAFAIDYCKEYGSYVQRVVADGVCYG